MSTRYLAELHCQIQRFHASIRKMAKRLFATYVFVFVGTGTSPKLSYTGLLLPRQGRGAKLTLPSANCFPRHSMQEHGKLPRSWVLLARASGLLTQYSSLDSTRTRKGPILLLNPELEYIARTVSTGS